MADSLIDKINSQLELSFVPPQNFYMIVERLGETSFMLQRLQIPVISGDEVLQQTPMNPSKTMIPGTGMEYSVLSCDFIIDKFFKNYRQVLEWMKNTHTPEDKFEQWKGWNSVFTDISVIATDSANIPVALWQFRDAFPISVDGPMFDATMQDVEYLTGNVTFRFKYFDFTTYTNGIDDQNSI